MMLLLWLAAATAVLAEDTHPGLVSKDSEQDLVAEASHAGSQAQKREATVLSNSYGEPLPPDAYGPPKDLPNTIPDLQLPAPIYGVPALQLQETPPGAYGPPAPISFLSQAYHGPPPPVSKPRPLYGPPKVYGPPKQNYGPPKIIGPPKPVYGPPKKTYGPPKQSLPKPAYGAPFKPPKFSLSKPFNFPKPLYGAPKPPKPVYGPPKITYGTPILTAPAPAPPPALPLPLPDLPQLSLPPLDNNIDLGLNLPAPIYGTPLLLPPVNINFDLKPNFPIPSDTYGPPGLPLGPVGPNDQIVVQNIASAGQFGPPQPDPNPQPPHPGIPAPPTPPHVLYDGWKPIPGVSQPFGQIGDQYGPPQVQEIQINFDQGLPNQDQNHQFSGAQITTGYSSVHQDALANIDLNAIVGGDSNNIDQSKTVFEAHYTENRSPLPDLTAIQSFPEKPLATYGAPPLDTLLGSSYPASIRQQGAKGLIPPSGFYGVPPGSQYGAPPKVNPNLPLPYGHYSGGGHSGGHTPQKPIKFRESVPEGLLQNVAQTTRTKDHHAHDHLNQGPSYLPPPIKDIKEYQNFNQGFHNDNFGLNAGSVELSVGHGISSGNLELGNENGYSNNGGVSLSIEPTNLYSLPHAGNPISFQQPSSSYGSPIDSYAAPFLTVGVGDHVTSGSNTNSITSTIDGNILANLSNLDAAAILKHCPYHEAIIKAAKSGERIPIDLASNYVASLSSLGTTLNKSVNTVTIPESYTKDLATSHSVIRSVYPDNQIKGERVENYSSQKGKSLRDKQTIKDERLQLVSDQILKTSEKIRSLNEQAKQLQQKIVSSGQNVQEEPSNGNGVSYSVQIQSSNDQKGKGFSPSIPHEQLLSEGLLQSILQAIEDPSTGKRQNQQSVNQQQFATNQVFANKQQNYQNQQFVNHQEVLSQQSQILGNQAQSFSYQQQHFNFANQSPSSFNEGLVLPAGYEPVDRTKTDLDVQGSSKNINHASHDVLHSNHNGCDLRGEGSIQTEVVVPPPKVNNVKSSDTDDVAIFFDDKEAPVTEISVATSISEEDSKKDFGGKTKS